MLGTPFTHNALADRSDITHVSAMLRRALILLTPFVLVITAGPIAYAQDSDDSWQPPMQSEERPGEDATDLIGRGVGILMENFMQELGPGLDQLGQDMSGALQNMTPVLKDLSVQIDDLRNYQAPERLENGDIIIRRKADAPPPPRLGDKLEDFTSPDTKPEPTVPGDPDAPELEL